MGPEDRSGQKRDTPPHACGVCASSGQKKPAGQTSQVSASEALWNVPPGHTSHSVSRSGVHGRSTREPGVQVLHGTQASKDSEDTVPTSHGSLSPPTQRKPGWQGIWPIRRSALAFFGTV
eukprot:scaffold5297_cov153-Pinguiococcus_pyrenoidosus.AAC.3